MSVDIKMQTSVIIQTFKSKKKFSTVLNVVLRPVDIVYGERNSKRGENLVFNIKMKNQSKFVCFDGNTLSSIRKPILFSSHILQKKETLASIKCFKLKKVLGTATKNIVLLRGR